MSPRTGTHARGLRIQPEHTVFWSDCLCDGMLTSITRTRSNPMPTPIHPTRRAFLLTAAASTVAASLPTILPSRVLGRDGNVPPGEKIALGVIGIGPRCTYDLKSMLQFDDIRCVAIADVQASRR